MKTAYILFFALTLTACLEEDESIVLDESTFTGTFVRLMPGEDAVESNIQLHLTNGTYTGTSDSLNYPAICQGTYTIEGQRITFANNCAWTADFDWTLILQGTYIIEENPDETVFIQEVGENEYNIYRFD